MTSLGFNHCSSVSSIICCTSGTCVNVVQNVDFYVVFKNNQNGERISFLNNQHIFLQSMIRLRLQHCRYTLTKIYQQSLELKRKINLAEQRCTQYVHRGNRTYRCHVSAYRCLNTSKRNRNVNHLFLKSDKNHLLWMGVRLIKRPTLSVVEMSEMLHGYTHIQTRSINLRLRFYSSSIQRISQTVISSALWHFTSPYKIHT